MNQAEYKVIDLFSGAGGMSYGFHRHPAFKVIGAVDAEIGKPSSGNGKLQCNKTYLNNIGILPKNLDLSEIKASELAVIFEISKNSPLNVLASCPPCTGFSRANPNNHLCDDKRNSLVRRTAEFAVAFDSEIVVMENARELIRGNFKYHYEWFREFMESNGYNVFGRTYMLTRFGLAQIRERAIIIAVKQHLPLYTLESLWDGWRLKDDLLTVRSVFGSIPSDATGLDVYPKFASRIVQKRIAAIPKDGGSWDDLIKHKDADILLTDSMKRIINKGKFGSYPDVYGRLSWNKPAPTIKRECCHVGNGRYAHPEENRLCSVREMASLQGFPSEYVFNGASVSNIYRHIGDAVPPLISYQLAHLCYWILSEKQPSIKDVLLENTYLRSNYLTKDGGSA